MKTKAADELTLLVADNGIIVRACSSDFNGRGSVIVKEDTHVFTDMDDLVKFIKSHFVDEAEAQTTTMIDATASQRIVNEAKKRTIVPTEYGSGGSGVSSN